MNGCELMGDFERRVLCQRDTPRACGRVRERVSADLTLDRRLKWQIVTVRLPVENRYRMYMHGTACDLGTAIVTSETSDTLRKFGLESALCRRFTAGNTLVGTGSCSVAARQIRQYDGQRSGREAVWVPTDARRPANIDR